MNLAEIMEQAKELTSNELEELALHIEFLRRTADPVWWEKIAQRAEANKRWYSEEDLREMFDIREGRVAEES
ncbi:MAG TPA: hypothetical protein VGM54_25580 [Chthoniobacter sp.]|jgi:hypothetical protein